MTLTTLSSTTSFAHTLDVVSDSTQDVVVLTVCEGREPHGGITVNRDALVEALKPGILEELTHYRQLARSDDDNANGRILELEAAVAQLSSELVRERDHVSRNVQRIHELEEGASALADERDALLQRVRELEDMNMSLDSRAMTAEETVRNLTKPGPLMEHQDSPLIKQLDRQAEAIRHLNAAIAAFYKE